jgi:hypothetical protein
MSRAAKSLRSTEPQHPLKQKLYFQELSPDIQVVKFRLSRESVLGDMRLFDPDDLLDEEADDLINRNNVRRTIREWLAFAERGE